MEKQDPGTAHERHFFTLCKELFNLMKFRFEAIYDYEFVPEIRIEDPQHPGDHKRLKLSENHAVNIVWFESI